LDDTRQDTERPAAEAPAPPASEPEPTAFGPWLVRAREKKKLSLDDVAHMTKIRRAILDALERDARRELPEKVFVAGYVRSYANALGLSVEDVLRRFNEAWPDLASAAADGGDGEPAKTRSWAWVAPVAAALVAAAVFWFIINITVV
jgi:cytoskeletal protein RodZ